MTSKQVEQLAATYYAKGRWSADNLAQLVAKGRLSKAAFKRITGRTYKEGA